MLSKKSPTHINKNFIGSKSPTNEAITSNKMIKSKKSAEKFKKSPKEIAKPKDVQMKSAKNLTLSYRN